MHKHYLDIAGKWAFVFAYDFCRDDLAEIGDWLDALGAKPADIVRAQGLLLRPNKGFSFSNDRLRMSVVVIGNATSIEQWWDTVSHEIDHVQDAILEYYGVAHGTEDAAWLQGYIMRLIVRALKVDGVM
jgi:hypothetical protein